MAGRGFTEARTLLFVPGHRPNRFERARDSGADSIILDLEDAIGPSNKDDARRHVEQWLLAGEAAVVRVNAVGTPWHDSDLQAILRTAPTTPVMLPKSTAAHVAYVEGRLPHKRQILALIETAEGVLEAAEIARSDGVGRLAFGNVDLGTDIGVDPDDRVALLHARALLVLASAAARIAPPVDGVTTAIDDDAALSEDAAASRAAGFGGKLCIHPRQISVVERMYTPAAAEIEWAERVIAASGGGDVTTVDGKMIDRPVVERARRVLDLSDGPC